MSEPVLIGTGDGAEIHLDVGALVGSHLGIVANSGGGKSGVLRKVLEATHSQIQHIILDSEDEFYTLRERFEYVIAGGEGGDAPAKPGNAAELARAALTHGFSLICQINDLGREGAAEFVDRFLSAMISAPRELWRPCLIVIDEAQRYPAETLQQLTEAGRKRGFTAVIATQRLPKLDANVRGDINNWMMGRVGQALDKRHIADQLGMTPTQMRDALDLEVRHFWAFGPAISREPVLFRVGDVETTMLRPGKIRPTTPPPPEALREIMAGLKVPEAPAAEVETVPDGAMHTQEVADLRVRCAEMEAREADWTVEMAFGQQQLEAVTAERDELRRLIAGFFTSVDRLKVANLGEPRPEAPTQVAAEPIAPVATPKPARQPAPARERGSIDLPKAAVTMIAMLDRISPARVTWAQLAAMCGYKPGGGNFNSARKAMRESGLVVETDDTILSAKPPASNMTREGARQLWKSVLQSPAPQMLDALTAGPKSREGLAQMLGKTPSGGHWNNGIAQLRRNGLITERDGLLSLANPLPGESA